MSAVHSIGSVLVFGGAAWAVLGAVAYWLSGRQDRTNRKVIEILLGLDLAAVAVGAVLLAAA